MASVEIGNGLDGLPAADPLKLIKNATVPLLSSEKRKRKAGPLEFLVQVPPPPPLAPRVQSPVHMDIPCDCQLWFLLPS